MHARQQQNLRKAKIIASKMEKRDNPEAKNSLRYLWEKKAGSGVRGWVVLVQNNVAYN